MLHIGISPVKYTVFKLLLEVKIIIKILCVGNIKENYIRSGINEYIKKISKHTKIEIIEINDEPTGSKYSDTEVLDIEGKRIIDKLDYKSFVISLCIEGKPITTEKFSSLLNKHINIEKTPITFIIGGSLGLSDEVKKTSNLNISFSKLTFPHQLMRLILLKQIYSGLIK